MKLEFYTHPKMDQHAYIKWAEEGRWFNLHERMIPTQDAKFHSTKLMLNEIGPFSVRSAKEQLDKIDVPPRCSLEDIENSIRMWNDTLQHPEKSKLLRTQADAAVEVKNTDSGPEARSFSLKRGTLYSSRIV